MISKNDFYVYDHRRKDTGKYFISGPGEVREPITSEKL